MKKALQLIFIFFISFAAFGQDYTLTPGTFGYDLDGTEANKIGFTLTNNSTSELTWYWEVEKGEDFPEEWDVQVCDQTLCWNPNILKMPTGRGTNTLGISKSTNPKIHHIKVIPNGKAGKGVVKFKIYDDADFSNVIVESEISTAVDNAVATELSIYPNPAQDFITVNGTNISKIDIHDITGRRLKSFSHNPNASHDISTLRNGLYLVRVFDLKGKIVKSMRLSKR